LRAERIEPGPGQESVWDYPRPPQVEEVPKRIQIVFNGLLIADAVRAQRVLETSHPPMYYIPPKDVCLVQYQSSCFECALHTAWQQPSGVEVSAGFCLLQSAPAEASTPTTWYGNALEYPVQAAGSSVCEWKGRAKYYTVTVSHRRTERAA